MSHQDKGLVTFNGQPLIASAIAALSPLVDELMINANRNIEQYRQLGYSVITDQNNDFDGPLAGVLSAMTRTHAELLMFMPCDMPLIRTRHLQKILHIHQQNKIDVVVAFDGHRLHPVVFSVKPSVLASLRCYLSGSQRKVLTWLTQQHWLPADFSDEPAIFANVNSPEELLELEMQFRKKG